MKQVLEITHLSDLNKAVMALQSMLDASKNIILLNGDLGAGKTTFVIEYCKFFGLQASSPTFSVIQNYKNEKVNIAHVDLYRLNDDSEIDSVGFWDLFSNSYNIIFIEWSTKLNRNDLPLDWTILNIDLLKTGETQRVMTITQY